MINGESGSHHRKLHPANREMGHGVPAMKPENAFHDWPGAHRVAPFPPVPPGAGANGDRNDKPVGRCRPVCTRP